MRDVHDVVAVILRRPFGAQPRPFRRWRVPGARRSLKSVCRGARGRCAGSRRMDWSANNCTGALRRGQRRRDCGRYPRLRRRRWRHRHVIVLQPTLSALYSHCELQRCIVDLRTHRAFCICELRRRGDESEKSQQLRLLSVKLIKLRARTNQRCCRLAFRGHCEKNFKRIVCVCINGRASVCPRARRRINSVQLRAPH